MDLDFIQKGGRFKPLRILILTDSFKKWDDNMKAIFSERLLVKANPYTRWYTNEMFEITVTVALGDTHGRRYDHIVIDTKVNDDEVKEYLIPLLCMPRPLQYVGLSNARNYNDICEDGWRPHGRTEMFEKEYEAIWTE